MYLPYLFVVSVLFVIFVEFVASRTDEREVDSERRTEMEWTMEEQEEEEEEE